jgi:hypothetical protein
MPRRPLRREHFGHVTRARLTQIMNLLNLAPDFQDEILFLPSVAGQREAISERQMRKVAAMADWGRQRKVWVAIAKPRQQIPVCGKSG